MQINALEISESIAKLADEKMAEDIVIMKMNEVSGLCDYFVICSASSNIRAKTIAEHVRMELKQRGQSILHSEGIKEGSWIVLDFGDVVVHIFQSDIRQYYNLEQLWGDAPRHVMTP